MNTPDTHNLRSLITWLLRDPHNRIPAFVVDQRRDAAKAARRKAYEEAIALVRSGVEGVELITRLMAGE